jgi:hypothetical protein
MLGILLMLIGGSMATVGYYANDFAIGELKNHTGTVRVKSEQRGLHLNNLSYLGPIVMGVGGKYLMFSNIKFKFSFTRIIIIFNLIPIKCYIYLLSKIASFLKFA